jgi:exopolyphosphatase/guanosine-5'-triphosphate,3'-diphosphate pyrophosphatase
METELGRAECVAGEAVRLPPPVFAAIDLGTNNCRLLVGSPSRGGVRVIDSYSRTVRLGEGLHETGRLSEGGMARAIAALRTCAGRVDRRPLRAMRAVATEACRRASNGAEFLRRARAETGLDIDVISTREEAELAVESCAPLLRPDERRALLFDIGGGSTELAWIRVDAAGGYELIGYASLPIGVVTVAEEFGEAIFAEDGFEAVVAKVVAPIAAFDRVHCISREIRCGGVRLLGTSGTVTTLAGVAMRLDRYRRGLVDGVVLTRDDAAQAVDNLRALGPAGLASHHCVGPDRADFVLPGCAIYVAITRLWPAPRITVADRGLREGILVRLIRGDRRRGPHAYLRSPVLNGAPLIT